MTLIRVLKDVSSKYEQLLSEKVIFIVNTASLLLLFQVKLSIDTFTTV